MTFASSAESGVLSVSIKVHLSALTSSIVHDLVCEKITLDMSHKDSNAFMPLVDPLPFPLPPPPPPSTHARTNGNTFPDPV